MGGTQSIVALPKEDTLRGLLQRKVNAVRNRLSTRSDQEYTVLENVRITLAFKATDGLDNVDSMGWFQRLSVWLAGDLSHVEVRFPMDSDSTMAIACSCNGTRGTYMFPKKLQSDNYNFYWMYMTQQESDRMFLWFYRHNRLPFNSPGFWRCWSRFFYRPTTYDTFFCSEFVTSGLQESGFFRRKMINDGPAVWNPGAITPAYLLSNLSSHGVLRHGSNEFGDSSQYIYNPNAIQAV